MSVIYARLSQLSFHDAALFSVCQGIQQVMASVRSIIKKLSKEDIARSILVSNIPSGTKEEALVIHFQQHKHGGGDVSSVVFTQDRHEAIITFEDAVSKYCIIYL